MKLYLFILIVVGVGLNAQSQEPPKSDTEESATQQAVAAMIQQTTKQLDEHLLLQRLLGNWKFASLEGDKQQQVGHARFRSIAFGNFVVDETVGMQLFIEEDFEFGGPQLALISHGVYGFDPLKSRYTATWYTNFNTIAFQGTAEVKPDQNHLDFHLEHPLIAMAKTADQRKAIVYRITFVDDDHLRLEFLELRSEDQAETRFFGVSATKVAPK